MLVPSDLLGAVEKTDGDVGRTLADERREAEEHEDEREQQDAAADLHDLDAS